MSLRHKAFSAAFAAIAVTGADRWGRGLAQGRGAILTLHHVRPAGGGGFRPNRLLAITPGFLDRVLTLIRAEGYDIVSLDEALVRLTDPRPGRFFVALTFDDGYRDNLDHAWPVLALSDQPNGDALCTEVYGERAALVPYIMPGFALAKAAADVFDADPRVEGLILDKHGIFTFGASAQQSYERMIAMVSRAEEFLARGRKTLPAAALPARIAPLAEVAPILRGACSLADDRVEGAFRRLVLDFRCD